LLIGFSDLTALLIPFYDQLGWLGLHGPMLTSNLITEQDPFTAQQLQAMWTGSYQQTPCPVLTQGPLVWLHGQDPGPLPITGGNLSLLASLCGTPWQPHTHGHWLFVEDWKEAYYSLDRQWQQLKLAGMLYNVAGIAFGEFSDIRQDADWSLLEQLTLLTKELGVPVVAGVSAGHGVINTTIPIGATVVFFSTV
jgi:muramoyltetrapeptide carboxypeptidase